MMPVKLGASKFFGFEWRCLMVPDISSNARGRSLFILFFMELMFITGMSSTTGVLMVLSVGIQYSASAAWCLTLVRWKNWSQTLTSGAAIWRIFLAHFLDSVSNRECRDLSVWRTCILQDMGAAEVLNIRLPTILAGVCRMLFLHL